MLEANIPSYLGNIRKEIIEMLLRKWKYLFKLLYIVLDNNYL